MPVVKYCMILTDKEHINYCNGKGVTIEPGVLYKPLESQCGTNTGTACGSQKRIPIGSTQSHRRCRSQDHCPELQRSAPPERLRKGHTDNLFLKVTKPKIKNVFMKPYTTVLSSSSIWFHLEYNVYSVISVIPIGQISDHMTLVDLC